MAHANTRSLYEAPSPAITQAAKKLAAEVEAGRDFRKFEERGIRNGASWAVIIRRDQFPLRTWGSLSQNRNHVLVCRDGRQVYCLQADAAQPLRETAFWGMCSQK